MSNVRGAAFNFSGFSSSTLPEKNCYVRELNEPSAGAVVAKPVGSNEKQRSGVMVYNRFPPKTNYTVSKLYGSPEPQWTACRKPIYTDSPATDLLQLPSQTKSRERNHLVVFFLLFV